MTQLVGSLGEHEPVMVAEVLAHLALAPGATVVDGTCGQGGHLLAMRAVIGPTGRALAVDLDPAAVAALAAHLGPAQLGDGAGQVRLVPASFAALPRLVREFAPDGVDAILLDLGVSRDQLTSERFSFHGTGPLDGRIDPSRGEPASALLARLSEPELTRLLAEGGDEPFAARIARGIVEARRQGPLERADQLVAVVVRAYPPGARHRRTHVATRTFQALRLAVNGLTAALEDILAHGPGLLKPGGRFGVLTFHSGEDRRVKRGFAAHARSGDYELVTRKPLVPSVEECRANPSARSAKLRVLAAARELRRAA
jgi:16S rRNA (cytosine1402-N4)-methyltransferase